MRYDEVMNIRELVDPDISTELNGPITDNSPRTTRSAAHHLAHTNIYDVTLD